MSGDELFSADPEKILKRAMSDVRFARSGYEAGHSNQALLLVIRGLEKMFLYHLMVREIPYSRETSSLLELLEHFSDTPFYTAAHERLCRQLDVFQFERRDEVMQIIRDDDQYMTLSDLDEEDVEQQREQHRESLEDEELEDWENGEWGPEGWSKRGADEPGEDVLATEGADRSADDGPPEFESPSGGGDPGGTDDTDGRTRPDLNEEDLPPPDELYEQSILMFKALFDLVDAGGGER